MNKILYLALLAIGAVLIVYGFNAFQSLGSDFSRLFTGSPTDKSIWLLVGGIILAAVGVAGLLRRTRSH